jgi:UDP-N-acetylmuramoylalanine--D-glutamate ligase
MVEAESMDDAVARAFALAERGDVVLLAPACSSFDMFTDYAARGRAFKEAVRKLGAGG